MICQPWWRRLTQRIARNPRLPAQLPRRTCRPAVEALEVREVLTAPTIVGSPLSGPYLSVPVAGPADVSGVIGDPTDPARTLGLVFTVGDAETPVGDLTVMATSDNQAVVPDANLSLSGGGADRTLKITPIAVGRAVNITVTVTDGEALSATYVVQYAASAASATPSLTRFLTGASDLSTAIAVDGYMWVANDEDQVLRLYDPNQSGLPISTFPISDATLGLTEAGKEVDIEASTRVGLRLYWMGSMSNRGDQNKDAPNRSRVFATDLSGIGAASTLTFVGHYDNLLQDLKDWDDNNVHGLGAGFFGVSASEAAGRDPKADDGFNLEGLTMAPGSATTAYLGFRAPIEPTSNRTKALIVPITNFPDLINGTPPVFGAPIQLDLNTPGEFSPRGIRSMESNGSQILIVAGPTGEVPADAVNPFKLFTWDGDPAHAPRALAANLAGQRPEAIVAVPAGPLTPTTVVQLISDNGTTVYYGDGIAAKDLTQSNFKKASADLVTLGKEVTDLAVAISDGVTMATVGTSVSYAITVTNNDPSSSRGEVVVTVTLPPALQGVTFTPNRGTYNSSIGVWTLPANAPLDFAAPGHSNTAVLTVLGTIDSNAAGTLSVTARVDLGANDTLTLVDTNPANNSATDTDTLTPRSVPPVTGPPAPVAGPPAALSASQALVSRGRGKPKRLVFRVQFSDGTQREIDSPFQKPQFKSILQALVDTNGNGTLDSLRITARRGSRKVVRTIAL